MPGRRLATFLDLWLDPQPSLPLPRPLGTPLGIVGADGARASLDMLDYRWDSAPLARERMGCAVDFAAVAREGAESALELGPAVRQPTLEYP